MDTPVQTRRRHVVEGEVASSNHRLYVLSCDLHVSC